jgi:hypothetical protein
MSIIPVTWEAEVRGLWFETTPSLQAKEEDKLKQNGLGVRAKW